MMPLSVLISMSLCMCLRFRMRFMLEMFLRGLLCLRPLTAVHRLLLRISLLPHDYVASSEFSDYSECVDSSELSLYYDVYVSVLLCVVFAVPFFVVFFLIGFLCLELCV